MDFEINDIKIAWGTVVYPEALVFFTEHIKTVMEQNYKEFSLLIVNENVDTQVLDKILCETSMSYTIVPAKKETSAVKNRIHLVKEACLRNIDLLIIGDCDDLFSYNRVISIKDAYEKDSKASFFYNTIYNMDGGRVMPELPKITNSIKNIAQYNYLGMSNTAINLKKISLEFVDSLNECSSNIFDWYLYTRILLNGGYGCFVEDAKTFYRIYDTNVVGVREKNDENINYEKRVKKKHYELLSKYDILFKDLYRKYAVSEIKDIPIITNKELHFWWDLLYVEV